MKHMHFLLAFITALFISACGGGSGSSTTAATIVSGVASKGPLNAATVCAYTISGGAKGAAVGSCTTTDVNGRYSIDLGTYTGPVLFEATGGTYIDEATGTTVTLALPLHSIQTNAAGSCNAAVTALTELAFKQASAAAGGLTTPNIQAAASNVQANFGVVDIVNTQPVDALNIPATATAAQKTYALALSAISQYQQPAGTSLDNSLQEMLACLAAPTSGCGKGAASVGVRLNAALSTFQAAHPLFSDMPSPVLKFGSQTTDNLVKYQTITVAGLNRLNKLQPVGTLVVSDSTGVIDTVIDSIDITADGTYTFPTPITWNAATLLHISQPAGKAACKFTSLRQDQFDPYTKQLITSNTSDIYCFESPCGSILSLGQAPAPKGLTVTKNPDSTVSLSWQNDPWANGYRLYYGTDPNVVTTAPMTGFAVYQNQLAAIKDPWTYTVPPNTTYYYAITSTYSSPANLEYCQSSASTSVTSTAPAPTISGMSPSTGAAGTTIVISGTNFSTTLANNTVKFNGTAANVMSASATSITVMVPSGAASGAITVTTASGTATSVGSFTVPISTAPAPTITGMSVSTGPVGMTIQITGTNFSTTLANNIVMFNGTLANVMFSATATSIYVEVPSGATSGAITVTTASGTATSVGSFTVPIITVSSSKYFTIQGTSTFTDRATGLVWFQAKSATKIDWPTANTYCAGLGGRLPTIGEILSTGWKIWNDSDTSIAVWNSVLFIPQLLGNYFDILWSSTACGATAGDVAAASFDMAVSMSDVTSYHCYSNSIMPFKGIAQCVR